MNIPITHCVKNEKKNLLIAEASDLELLPGAFPNSVTLIDGMIATEFYYWQPRYEHDELIGIEYQHKANDAGEFYKLIILND